MVNPSFMITNAYKIHGFFLNTSKQTADIRIQIRFCSAMSKRSNILRKVFFIFNLLCKISIHYKMNLNFTHLRCPWPLLSRALSLRQNYIIDFINSFWRNSYFWTFKTWCLNSFTQSQMIIISPNDMSQNPFIDFFHFFFLKKRISNIILYCCSKRLKQLSNKELMVKLKTSRIFKRKETTIYDLIYNCYLCPLWVLEPSYSSNHSCTCVLAK